MSSNYMRDLGSRLDFNTIPELKNYKGKKDNTSLEMTDFLNLMVVQLQNQSLDSAADTSDMLNQMVQMQMITALSNMTDASVMGYASSLVGQEVTIGDYSSGQLEERLVTITGTGLSNGKQVVFAGDEIFDLSSIMAVGRLPEKVEETEEGQQTQSGVQTTQPPKNE